MVTSSMNGRAKRPSLTEQIERLDRVLDGLAESIPEAVALAVKEAMAVVVKHAVEAAIAEALREQERRRAETEPTLPKVQPTTEPTAMAPTTMEQVCGKVKALGATLKGWLTGVVGVAAPRCILVWRMRRHLAWSLGVGVVAGVTAWLLGPTVSAAGVGLVSAVLVGLAGLTQAKTTTPLRGPN